MPNYNNNIINNIIIIIIIIDQNFDIWYFLMNDVVDDDNNKLYYIIYFYLLLLFIYIFYYTALLYIPLLRRRAHVITSMWCMLACSAAPSTAGFADIRHRTPIQHRYIIKATHLWKNLLKVQSSVPTNFVVLLFTVSISYLGRGEDGLCSNEAALNCGKYVQV